MIAEKKVIYYCGCDLASKIAENLSKSNNYEVNFDELKVEEIPHITPNTHKTIRVYLLDRNGCYIGRLESQLSIKTKNNHICNYRIKREIIHMLEFYYSELRTEKEAKNV